MKNTLIVVLTVTSLALGALCIVQWQSLSAQKNQIASLRGQMEQKAQELADLQASQKHVEEQRRELLEQASDLATQLQTRPPTDAKNSAAPVADATSESESAQ